uniref:CSON012853 protein n=1 Tax=Culicoides sonorensis TaxID=179676 RepID=A0A336LR97_CULSO
MTAMDSDATFCTEIENHIDKPKSNPSQALKDHLTLENSQQPSTQKRYNTRRSQQEDTAAKDLNRQNQLAELRNRLKQIQVKLRKQEISQDESPALEIELKDLGQKFQDKRTKNAIQAAVNKLLNIKESRNFTNNTPKSVVSQSQPTPISVRRKPPTRITGKRRRPIPKALVTKTKSAKFKDNSMNAKTHKARGRPFKTTKKPPVKENTLDSDGLLELSKVNETLSRAEKIVNESINLFNQKQSKPYQEHLSQQMDRLKDIIALSKVLMEKYSPSDPKNQKQEKSFKCPLPVKIKPKFDPYVAPYSESVFSNSLKAGSQRVFTGNVVSEPVFTPSPKIAPTHNNDDNNFQFNQINYNDISSSNNLETEPSLFDESFIPLAQPNRSIMEYDQIMETSIVQGTSFGSNQDQQFMIESDFFNSYKYVKSDSSLIGQNDLYQSLNNLTFDSGPRITTTILENVKSFPSFPSVSGISKINVEKENSQFNAPVFSPLHVKLLAERLSLNEIFLRKCIFETYKKAQNMKNEDHQDKSPEPMDIDCDTHVSASPNSSPDIRERKAMRAEKWSQIDKESKTMFNLPIFTLTE